MESKGASSNISERYSFKVNSLIPNVCCEKIVVTQLSMRVLTIKLGDIHTVYVCDALGRD